MKRLLAIAAAILVGGLPAPLLAQQPHPEASGIQQTRRAHVRIRDAAKGRRFWLTVAGIFASSIFDAETTARCITHHPQCQELNPIFGPRPSRKRLYGIKFGLNALEAYAVLRYWRLDMEDDIEWRRWCEMNPGDPKYSGYCTGHTHAVTGWPRAWQVALVPIGVNAASGIYNSARRFPTCPNGTVCR